MGFYDKLCPGCMNDVGDATVCPHCNFDLNKEQESPFLPYGYVLAGKYVIGEVLEQNGEGITYLGLDSVTNNCVRVREFFPGKLANREKGVADVTVGDANKLIYRSLIEQFLNLWHILLKLRANDSFITVLDVFETNYTAYSVSDADGSMTLSEYLSEKGETLSWNEITEKIFPVLDGIKDLHENGIIHGALSPDTLFLCSNGSFKPWGFGINESHKVNDLIEAELRPGYCAAEQYDKDGNLSEATDIYGFAASLYRCITSSSPEDALKRRENDSLNIPAVYARELPDYVLAGFISSLQLEAEDRTKNVDSLKKSFTKEGFETQKKLISTKSFIDPISDITSGDIAAKNPSAPVIVTAPGDIKVVKPQEEEKITSTVSSTVVMCVSIVLVMILFFATLVLTGIVSFNVGGAGTTAKVVEMPDFTNIRKDDAYITQVAEKYNIVITIQPEGNVNVAKDLIFDQSIPAGTKVASGTKLLLKYSKGPATVTLPNFTGQTFTETVYYLGKLNLSYNIVERENNGSQRAGTIATMSPAAGSVVYEGTEITIEVWGDAPGSNGDIIGPSTGSTVTSSSSILDNVIGRLSDSVSGLGSTIQGLLG